MSRDLMRKFNMNPVSPDTLGPLYQYVFTEDECYLERVMNIVEHNYMGAIRTAKTTSSTSYTYSLINTGVTFEHHSDILVCLQEYFEGCVVELEIDLIRIDWS